MATPIERWGRKATGLKPQGMAAGLPKMQVILLPIQMPSSGNS